MALTKPIISVAFNESGRVFDARNGCLVHFKYYGEWFSKKQFIITNVNGNTIYQSGWIINSDYIISIPSNILNNATTYLLRVQVATETGASDWSDSCMFWCYAPARISINGLSPIIFTGNQKMNFIGLYTMEYAGGQPISDNWYSCQYVLYQINKDSGIATVIGNSGTMYIGSTGAFPSFLYEDFTRDNDTNYRIKLTCTTEHGIQLEFSFDFIVQYAQPSIFVNADITNTDDGKIKIVGSTSRIRALENAIDYKFIQDPNDILNYWVDLGENEFVTFQDGLELLESEWSIILHLKNFRGVEYTLKKNPVTGFVIGRRPIRNYFAIIKDRHNDNILKAYFNSLDKRFHFEYSAAGIISDFTTNDSFSFNQTVKDNKTVYSDMVSLLIRKEKNDFIFHAVKAL